MRKAIATLGLLILAGCATSLPCPPCDPVKVPVIVNVPVPAPVPPPRPLPVLLSPCLQPDATLSDVLAALRADVRALLAWVQSEHAAQVAQQPAPH